jgi:hypothetical protein
MEQKPKEFYFCSTFGLPNPFDWALDLNMLEVQIINS